MFEELSSQACRRKECEVEELEARVCRVSDGGPLRRRRLGCDTAQH